MPTVLPKPGYAAFFLLTRLAQPLPNQPPRMGGAELSGALWSPGAASSLLLHSDFLLWLPSSPARRGVAKEKMGSCHLTEREAASDKSETLSVATLPGRPSEASCLLPLPCVSVVAGLWLQQLQCHRAVEELAQGTICLGGNSKASNSPRGLF